MCTVLYCSPDVLFKKMSCDTGGVRGSLDTCFVCFKGFTCSVLYLLGLSEHLFCAVVTHLFWIPCTALTHPRCVCKAQKRKNKTYS